MLRLAGDQLTALRQHDRAKRPLAHRVIEEAEIESGQQVQAVREPVLKKIDVAQFVFADPPAPLRRQVVRPALGLMVQ
jgi:hypothetical protein